MSNLDRRAALGKYWTVERLSPRTLQDFTIVTTADGSPSLSIEDSSGYVEKMHHAAGAMSESIYIYGEAVQKVLDRRWPLRVLSVGLGLGYNELITAASGGKSEYGTGIGSHIELRNRAALGAGISRLDSRTIQRFSAAL